jgi:plasmid replication initiation protein
MMEENNQKNENLKPADPQMDLLVLDVFDVDIKEDLQSMEHPFYALSKKKDLRVLEYQHGDKYIKITPSVQGRPTIFDKDVLIFAVSQIVAKMNAHIPVSRRVSFTAYDLLKSTNRGTGGKEYQALKDALERLSGARILTNIPAGKGVRIDKGFGFIDNYEIHYEEKGNRMVAIEITLNEWIFAAIDATHFLTLDKKYFQLGRPLDRRIYELARKHCGDKKRWKCSLEILHKKSGSQAQLKKFKFELKKLIEADYLPGYRLELTTEEGKGDSVIFYSRDDRGELARIKDQLD